MTSMYLVSIADCSVVTLAAFVTVITISVNLVMLDLVMDVLVMEGKTPTVGVTSLVAIRKVWAVECHCSDVGTAPLVIVGTVVEAGCFSPELEMSE